MTDRSSRRAARLVRLYPRQWRQQFPDFEEILVPELSENRRGVRRDVVRAALSERLRELGIIPKRPSDGARSGLALIYAALVPFAGLAVGMWSQLHTGLASAKAATPPVLDASSLLLTIGTLVVLVAFPFAIFLLLAEVPRMRRDKGTMAVAPYWPLVPPSLAFIGSLGALAVAGWGAERSGWYSPAAAALPHGGAAYVATLWVRGITAAITPAWIHPTLFARMPTAELVAALLAPVAAFAASAALFRLILRVPVAVSRRANIVLAAVAFGMMFVSVFACGRWLLNHPTREGATSAQARSDQLAPGHTGWVVVLVLGALTITALVGLRRLARSKRDDPPLAGGRGSPRPVTDRAMTSGTFPLRFSTA
jgi:hypothetical protein